MIQRIDLNEPKSIQLLRSRASTVDLEGDISKTVLSIHPSFNANGSIKHEDPETQLMEGYHNLIMMLDVINTSRDEVIAIKTGIVPIGSITVKKVMKDINIASIICILIYLDSYFFIF